MNKSMEETCPLLEWPWISSAWHPGIFYRCLQPPISTPSTPPSPNSIALRLSREGMKGCSPAVPLHSPQWPFSGPLCAPPLPSTLHSPSQPLALQPPTHPIAPPLPCWAGDRPLNAGPGVPDGSYRWSVVIGPIEPCHRLFPAKIQRLGHITSTKKTEWERKRAKEKAQGRGWQKQQCHLPLKESLWRSVFSVVSNNKNRETRQKRGTERNIGGKGGKIHPHPAVNMSYSGNGELSPLRSFMSSPSLP